MEKWKVKTIEPTTTIDSTTGGLKMTGYNTVDVEAEFLDISDSMVTFYKTIIVENIRGGKVDKRIVSAAFSIHNIISVIRVEENNNE